MTTVADGARHAITAWLQSFVDDGVLPGATWVVARGRVTLATGAVGARCLAPRAMPLQDDAVYDLASLTKPLATAALAVKLARAGCLSLDEPAGTHLPELDGSPYADVTLLDLLLHRAGLPAWEPLFLLGGGPGCDMRAYLPALAALPPVSPAGDRVVYSDPGYFLAGEIVARAGGRSLDELFNVEILARLQPPGNEPRFCPPESWLARVAPTEVGDTIHRRLAERHAAPAAVAAFRGWSEAVLLGEVHDRNARALGGVAGNAGLFGSAAAIAILAAEFLPGSRLFDPQDLSLFATSQTSGLEQERSVGFRVAAATWGVAGDALSPASFGHTGFTGPSLMLDPDSGGIYVLLTNRIHQRPASTDLTAVRAGFHQRAAALLGAAG